jgi:hypothetical protein
MLRAGLDRTFSAVSFWKLSASVKVLRCTAVAQVVYSRLGVCAGASKQLARRLITPATALILSPSNQEATMKQFFSIRVIALVTILLLWFAVVAMSVKPVPATSGAQAEQTYAPSAKE